MKDIVYSLIVPAFNEQEVLPVFFEKVIPMFEGLNEEFEVIVINDGSKDGTEQLLADYCKRDCRIKAINFSRNFGQQAALTCGFKESKGRAVIAMDADLQDPPEVALEMIEKWKEGYDVVHGRRKKRPGESLFKRVTSSMYLKLLSRVSTAKVPENVGEFKLFSRAAVDAILSLPEKSRYLRAQTAWIGFKQTFVDFDRPAREVGETKYTVKKLIKLAVSGIISNSNYPLTLALKIGMWLSGLSAACFLTFAILAICEIVLPIGAWLFPFVSLLVGIDLTVKGFSDVYLSRMYDEVKARPVYLIKDKLNFEDED